MTLYVVATPIGNLGDMSPRAVETLKNVQLIAAEDTRVTMKLTSHFDIHTPLTSCHRHNEAGKAQEIVSRMLEEGIDVALVTDAGTPGVSDPGMILTRLCAEADIPVVAVPGPTALAAALSVSGFDVTEFTFYGFLPREKKPLEEKLKSMIGQQAAIIHESPFRVTALMESIARVLPEARVSASCDLSKLHELTLRGTPAGVLEQLKANDKTEKGEYCIVLDLRGVPVPEREPAEADIRPELRLLDLMLEGLSLREARERLQAEGLRKNELYAAALRIKDAFEIQ